MPKDLLEQRRLMNWYIMCLSSLNQGDTIVIPDKYYSNLICIVHEMELGLDIVNVGFVNNDEVKLRLRDKL